MIDDRANVPAAEPEDDGGPPSAYGVPKLRRQVLQRLADAFADDNLELAEYERRVREEPDERGVHPFMEGAAPHPGCRT